MFFNMHNIKLDVVANCVESAGGELFMIGGAVRDFVMSKSFDNVKDFDFVVIGLTFEETSGALETAASINGTFLKLKSDNFPVFSMMINGMECEFAMARKERRVGLNHNAFKATIDPSITIEEDCERRDFRMNAMALNTDGEIIDPFCGQEDISNGVISHVNDMSFADDPVVRVFRAFQFSARFDMKIDQRTKSVCRWMIREFNTVAPERIWIEWHKWACKGVNFSHSIKFMHGIGALKHFPELEAMVNCPQDPEFHPEGDVFTHAINSANKMARICDEKGIVGDGRGKRIFAALLHDVGKPSTTVVKDGRIVSPGHAEAAEELIDSFFARIHAPNSWAKDVKPFVINHMRHMSFTEDPTMRAVRRFGRDIGNDWQFMADLVLADVAGRGNPDVVLPDSFVNVFNKVVNDDVPTRNIIMGRHVLPFFPGKNPDVWVGEILKQAEEAQMGGEFRTEEEAISWLKRHLGD